MSIKRPYVRHTETHTAEDIASWEVITLANDETVTAELRGKTFKISPALGDPLFERNHNHVEINVAGDEGSVLNIHMGHAPNASQYDRVFSTYYYTIDFKNVSAGPFVRDYPSAYGGRGVNWWLIEVKPDIEVLEIKHTFTVRDASSPRTVWMHDIPIDSFEFMGGRMRYSMGYPCDYDSEQDEKFPLVVSVGGSGELGDDGAILGQTDPGCIITRYQNFFETYKAFHLTIQIPYSNSFTETVPDPEMSPYHDGWSRYYHERSHGSIGCRLLIEHLLADADHHIDPDRIYLTGFSGGGLFSFEMLKGGRDIFAAIVPIAGWGIGRAYENVFLNPLWDPAPTTPPPPTTSPFPTTPPPTSPPPTSAPAQ